MLIVGEIDAGGVPYEGGRCAEDDVSSVVHVEVPGEGAIFFRARCRVGGLFGGADVDGLVGVARLFEASDLFGGEDIGGVHEYASAGDQEAGGNGDGVVEAAVFEVELAADVGEGVPAAEVVIDTHAWVPLGDVVDVAELGCAPGGVAPEGAGDGVVVAHMDAHGGVGLEGRGEADLHTRVGDEVVGLDGGGGACGAGLELDGFEEDAVGGLGCGCWIWSRLGWR